MADDHIDALVAKHNLPRPNWIIPSMEGPMYRMKTLEETLFPNTERDAEKGTVVEDG